ncbi:hypothetical protein SAY86_030539 [Trapa natans]|uniref:RING-type domain-containing protein n=1 Tax=Trapa natans TaxID=22666 RepID=A0AAN7RIJ7_TRANT|nr:hypothetical protein SAY86_030539 [Trapa natans]
MGGALSRQDSWDEREGSLYRSSSSAWDNNYGYSQYSYSYENANLPRVPSYAPPPSPVPSYAPPPPSFPSYAPPPPTSPSPDYAAQQFAGVQSRDNKKKLLDRRYSRIADNYQSLEEVTAALARSGLESSNLIVGIDFTKSNVWTGARSFHRQSLHHIGKGLNPYEQAISIIGKTMSAFDEDNLIPCFGFGDASTHDQDVFSFYPDERFCNGFEEVLRCYRELVPHLRLAGPTSFAPIIEMAMTIVEQSGGQYHVLLIIADGQVTRSENTKRGQMSPQERKTVEAIVAASKLPLSIIFVGVGDGPWDMMEEFDDNIPARAFDNFQFVNFTNIMSKNVTSSRKETEFALSALMEIPSQYKATIELNLLGNAKGGAPHRVPLPPPAQSFTVTSNTKLSGYETSVPSYGVERNPTASAPPAPQSTYDNQVCPICLTNVKDMAFGCGHQICCDCGQSLDSCPICRSPIQTRIKLY